MLFILDKYGTDVCYRTICIQHICIMHKNPRTLSGGQQKLLNLGMVLMADPAVVLLDEPSAGLAPKMVEVLMNNVREIKDGFSSVLLIEQNVKSVLRIADRGYILVMGKKVYEGDASEVLDHKEIGRL